MLLNLFDVHLVLLLCCYVNDVLFLHHKELGMTLARFSEALDRLNPLFSARHKLATSLLCNDLGAFTVRLKLVSIEKRQRKIRMVLRQQIQKYLLKGVAYGFAAR